MTINNLTNILNHNKFCSLTAYASLHNVNSVKHFPQKKVVSWSCFQSASHQSISRSSQSINQLSFSCNKFNKQSNCEPIKLSFILRLRFCDFCLHPSFILLRWSNWNARTTAHHRAPPPTPMPKQTQLPLPIAVVVSFTRNIIIFIHQVRFIRVALFLWFSHAES